LELNRLRIHRHPSTGRISWFANPATDPHQIRQRLDELAPLYASVSGGGFSNQTGDALEVITFKCLESIRRRTPRYTYQGHFLLSDPKDAQNRFRKIQPARSLGPKYTDKEADFLQFGHEPGPLFIECKNLHEWIYPSNQHIKDLILKSSSLDAVPLLIARRIHYTTLTNFLEPAGILAHESFHQYYPSDCAELAARVRDKNSLGFSDVLATEEPHRRTLTFFENILPTIVDTMAERWFRNADALVAFAKEEINLPQLYTEIGSPAGGKWDPR
jgi:hypothetical protein